MATGIEEIARQMEESPQEKAERLEAENKGLRAENESLKKEVAYWKGMYEESCRREQGHKETIDSILLSRNR